MLSRKCARKGMLAAAVLASLPAVSRAASAAWSFNGDGNWSDATKWNPNTVPNGAADIASFNLHPVQSAVRNITLDASITVSGINFTSAYQWIIGGTANTLT